MPPHPQDSSDLPPSSGGVERRSAPRSPIARVQVEMRTDPGSEKPLWAGSAVDVSETGTALVLPIEVDPGSEIYLSFQLGDGPRIDDAPARIVRKDNIGVGAVRFELLSAEALDAIRAFLAAR